MRNLSAAIGTKKNMKSIVVSSFHSGIFIFNKLVRSHDTIQIKGK
jgi:hypothetical protein